MKFTFMCKLILKFWLKSSSVQSHFGRFRSHILVYILSPSDLWLNQPRPVDSLLQFQIFQRKKTFNFPSSMTLQSFILSILFYLCCLHLAHCDFSVFFFFLKRLLKRWRTAGLCSACNNPSETWILLFISLPLAEEIFAGYFGRPTGCSF